MSFLHSNQTLSTFEASKTCTYVTRGQVPKDPGDEFFDFVVGRLPEKPNERRDAAGRLDGALVLVVLTTVRQVSEKLRQV